MIKGKENDIKIFRKICKMWEDEPDKFIVTEDVDLKRTDLQRAILKGVRFIIKKSTTQKSR